MKAKWIIYSFALLWLTGTAYAQEMARGYVFEDLNGNGAKERREKGIAGVSVTNGVDVVQTDEKGRYELRISDDQIISVIKPSAYDVPVDERQLPQFYYIHKPQGSPELKYPGVPPTGKLPRSIDFPLVKNNVGDSFQMILFGDPQTYTEQQVAYYHKGIINELVGTTGNVFGLSLGDLVGDRPDLFAPYIEATSHVGIPWYNVLGNHDINFDVEADSLSDESFEAHFGPANYAFNYGKVHFIVLDDVIYPDPRDGEGYWAGLNEDQFKFLENNLSFVPKDHLIVLAFHIPFVNVPGTFRREDRDRLFELLKDFPHTLSLSAHTHRQNQHFFGREDGWQQDTPHHHFNAGTTSGNWYSGAYNAQGVPVAMMSDGTPKGYSFVRFEGNQYEITYKVAGKPADYQIRIYAPKVIPHGVNSTSAIYANFFMGHVGNEVSMRVNGGEWTKMTLANEIDPTYLAELIRWDHVETLPKGRRPTNGAPSTHLWKAGIPRNLPVGSHKIEVRATDMFGRVHMQESTLRVERAD